MPEKESPEKPFLSNKQDIFKRFLIIMFSPHPNGVECLDITPDGKYIVTVSKEVIKSIYSMSTKPLPRRNQKIFHKLLLFGTGEILIEPA